MRGRAKCKIGEERGLACEKLQKNLSENSSYLTSPLRDPIREEANAGTHTTDAILLLRQKNRHDEDDMHDMAAMVRCNLSNLSGIGIPTHNCMVEVVLLPRILNVA